MASKLGKFELTFVFCEFVVTTTNFLQQLVVNRTTAANFFPPNFVALLCHVTGMRTKVQMDLKVSNRRRRQQERHKFAYLTVKNNNFPRFARALFIFARLVDVLVLSTT